MLRALCFAASSVAFPSAALAYASLQLAPRSVTLDAAHQVGQISMNSLDARDLIFDLEAVAWTQRGDADSFAPTTDLQIVPPVYDVQPYRRILIRVAMRGKTAAPAERAFQVRFREVPQPGSHETPRTLTATVFAAPAQPQGEAKYTLQREGERAAKLTIDDQSNAHVYLGIIRIESGGQEVYSGSLDAYVLAGNARSLPLQLTHELKPGEAQLTIETAGNNSTTVDVPVR
jgi:P pilus assembly chaperone PapD